MSVSFILLMTITIFGKTEQVFLPSETKPSYSEALSSCNNLKAQVTKIIDELDPEARNFIFLNKTECIADAGSRMVDVGEQLTKMNGGK